MVGPQERRKAKDADDDESYFEGEEMPSNGSPSASDGGPYGFFGESTTLLAHPVHGSGASSDGSTSAMSSGQPSTLPLAPTLAHNLGHVLRSTLDPNPSPYPRSQPRPCPQVNPRP
jgi:hypothetical protein